MTTTTTTAARPTFVKVANPKFNFGAEGTKRNASWTALRSLRGKKTIAAYLAAGGQRKYLSRWEKAGAITIH